ncbi:MAG: hypothetical protein KME01_14440 [Chroococcus sp. CMT-3BRIN-NPC107]|jgi:hypothetical protein|nr:hypothetical protein [Chroococcus sp. CMT-3BRIN-NPC107]
MAKRFGDLEKQALALLAAGSNPANSPDTALANYWQWKINPSASSHNLPADSERPRGRETSNVYLKPFSVTLAATIFAKVTISERSNTAAGAPVKAACEILADPLTPVTNIGLALKGFVPARVYWRTGRAEESTERISRITKRTYKSYYGASDDGFSVPFGAKGADSLATRQSEITTVVKALAGVGPKGLITFSPEKYRG